MTALLLGVVAASFLGSLHCAGMCGPLVCLYAQPGETPGRWLHAAYQGGRLATLLLIGIAAGALGTGVDALGDQAGLQRLIAVVAGGLAILWGVGALAVGVGLEPKLPGAVQSRIGALLGKAAALPPLRRALLIGGLTPLLPCGWLWLFVLAAAGTGHAASGAGVLAAFWLGNLPILTGLAVGLRGGLGKLRERLPTIGGVIMIGLGVALLVQRTREIELPGIPPAAAPAPAATGAPAPVVSAVAIPNPDVEPSCCSGKRQVKQ